MTFLKTCESCNSVLFDDGTAENCAGECDRDNSLADDYRPLNFDDVEVVRELPEAEELWSGLTPEEEALIAASQVAELNEEL